MSPPPRRWPLHPPPGPLESLSSWLARLARRYGMPVTSLLTHNLGLPALVLPDDLDMDPPAAMLAALAERTGTEQGRLQAMTLAGWVPWLLDTLHVRRDDAQATLEAYVRDNSVLLAPGEARPHAMSRRWLGPWLPLRPPGRACPACAARPDQGAALVWRLPLMTSCAGHGCRLHDSRGIGLAIALHGQPPPPVPASEPLATLDRCTHEALTTGQVTLAGRAVHAGVWFRLLRSLLDEVSLAPATRRGKATLEQVWQATGRPARAGLDTWRPYELLDAATQEAMLHAAAAAVQLAATGQITARGRLGSALQTPPRRRVYDGDRPSAQARRVLRLYDGDRSTAQARRVLRHEAERDLRQAELARSGEQVRQDLNTMLETARHDPGAARHMLAMLTSGPQTLESFAYERQYLIGYGIPAGYLPTSRDDLVATGRITTQP